MNALEQLRQYTTVVADTGDVEVMKQYTPTDATTNPSLILKASESPQYSGLIDEAVAYAKANASGDEILSLAADYLFVLFGREILNIVPRYVSTEVDARLSFDTAATVAKAKRIIGLYQQAGIDTARVLIKIAATWEGIQAAKQLETEGIHCNLTLLFGFGQAQACADAGVFLISPFVGRIFDWYKKADGVDRYPATEDPGVKSVSRIYAYYKKHGYKTLVMGASFRNSEQIKALAGSDLLTISPALLAELQNDFQPLSERLNTEFAEQNCNEAKHILSESEFRFALNADAMATEKLAEGIRGFATDAGKLEALIKQKI